MELARETAGGDAWYLADRLGSVRAEVAAAGTATARYDYDPFGQPVGASAPADYGYAGEPWDAAAGLVPLRTRWYAPAAGQFTGRDPDAHADPVNGVAVAPATTGPAPRSG